MTADLSRLNLTHMTDTSYTAPADRPRDPDASHIIDALGGTAAVARLLDVSLSAVSQWRESGLPDARRQTLTLLMLLHMLFSLPEITGATPPTRTKHEQRRDTRDVAARRQAA